MRFRYWKSVHLFFCYKGTTYGGTYRQTGGTKIFYRYCFYMSISSKQMFDKIMLYWIISQKKLLLFYPFFLTSYSHFILICFTLTFTDSLSSLMMDMLNTVRQENFTKCIRKVREHLNQNSGYWPLKKILQKMCGCIGKPVGLSEFKKVKFVNKFFCHKNTLIPAFELS